MTGKFIKWDNGGGFGRDDWRLLYQFIMENGIQSVLEYGCGLSTELMMAIGLEVLSIETDEKYADIPDANIITAQYPHYPEMMAHYDLGFIDGPGAYEFESRGKKPERTMSAIHASRYCNHVYMHDGALGQMDPFKNPKEWKLVRGGDSNIIYTRLL